MFMSINIDPLSDEEFEELDEFLLSAHCADEAMTMDVLHGFLTAIVVGPEPIPMSEWFAHVWGDETSSEPKFPSKAMQERITDLILRFMNEIAITFEVAPKEYEPLFCEHEWNGDILIDAEGWAIGFWEGINLRPAAWKPIWSSDIAALMQPFYLLGAEELDEDEEPLISDPVRLHKLAIQMEANIHPIRRFWSEFNSANKKTAAGAQSNANETALCTCGSGKKFSQCCGTAPTLH
jgi:uncharacterized protein